MRNNTNTKRIAVVGAVAVGLAILASTFSLASADGGFGPSACIEAAGFDGEFLGHAGGCKPAADEPVAVPDTITTNYTMSYGWTGGDADIFVVDRSSGREVQIDRTGSGNGMGYLRTGGSSSGWVVEARISGEPVARTTLEPSEIRQVDEGGWVHGDASVELVPLPNEVEVVTSVYAQLHDNDPRSESEPFTWQIVASDGTKIASGSGFTGATKRAVSWTAKVAAPKKVGVVDPTELPTYEVTYEYNGESYRTPALQVMQIASTADSTPLHFRGYGFGYNGTRLTQSSATAPRVHAEQY